MAVQLTAPRAIQGVWRISAADPGQPTKRFDMLIDASDGKQLYFAGWDQQTIFGKATAIGIPFHRGEFGWWNQALLLLFGVGALFSLMTGWMMYFKRRHWNPWSSAAAPGDVEIGGSTAGGGAVSLFAHAFASDRYGHRFAA